MQETPQNASNVPLLERVRAYSQKSSKGHRKIAEFILDNYVSASYMTASKLAQEVGVSESTVVRFAMNLGFEGYGDVFGFTRDI